MHSAFCALAALKTDIEDGQAVKIGSLHRVPSSLMANGLTGRNRHLTLAEAKVRLSSRASCCGHSTTHQLERRQASQVPIRVTLAGKDVVVSMDKNMLVINGASAPAADAFLILGETRSLSQNATGQDGLWYRQ